MKRRGVQRQIEDGYSDPDYIIAKYMLGRNAYFEVELVLADLADRERLANRGSFDIASFNFTGESDGIGTIGCPEEDDLVWVKGDSGPITVKARELLDKKHLVFNPMQGTYHKLKTAELIANATIMKLTTYRGHVARVTDTHQILTDTADEVGRNLTNMSVNDAVAVFSFNSDFLSVPAVDILAEITPIGFGNAVSIELYDGHIYGSSSRGHGGIAAHNRKQPIEIV